MSKLYLGFDAGTQSVKVSAYDENLKSITSQSLPTILRYPHAGWVEMDLDEFLDITVRCIKRCVDDIKALRLRSQRRPRCDGRRHYLRPCRCERRR